MLLFGDCLEQMRALAADSVDSIVTDPPYGWSFMGAAFDTFRTTGDLTANQSFQKFSEEWAREALRVLKPGGHMLVFCGPRTYHRMASGVEDAGFKIVDQIHWIFGSGFPKSTNLKKSGEKQGISCICNNNENLSNLPETMGTKESLSKSTQSDVLSIMCGQIDQQEQKGSISNFPNDLLSVQETLQAEMEKSSKDMQLSMQGSNEVFKAGNDGSYETNFKQYEGAQKGASIRREKSSMEGRCDLQEIERQLHRPEIREVSEGISTDGSQGRLHNGAPANYVDASGPIPNTDRSSSSQGSQYPQQSTIQSGMVSNQSGPQTCRRCGKPSIEEGLGTALKPAHEGILLARKPISEKTVAANVLKHGCGGINIDGSRIELSKNEPNVGATYYQNKGQNYPTFKPNEGFLAGKICKDFNMNKGRFPSNLILSHSEHCTDEMCDIECAIKMLDAQGGNLKSGGKAITTKKYKSGETSIFHGQSSTCYNDSGGASHFFYCAKISTRERNEGLEGLPDKQGGSLDGSFEKSLKTGSGAERTAIYKNNHPTVKPKKLMSYLIKMITAPGGICLDPFMGSGSTGVAAYESGFQFIGIEKEVEYFEIAKARIENCQNESRKD